MFKSDHEIPGLSFGEAALRVEEFVWKPLGLEVLGSENGISYTTYNPQDWVSLKVAALWPTVIWGCCVYLAIVIGGYCKWHGIVW